MLQLGSALMKVVAAVPDSDPTASTGPLLVPDCDNHNTIWIWAHSPGASQEGKAMPTEDQRCNLRLCAQGVKGYANSCHVWVQSALNPSNGTYRPQ